MLIWTPQWPGDAQGLALNSSKLADIRSAWVMVNELGLNLAGHTGTPLSGVEIARNKLLQAFPSLKRVVWLDQVHSTDLVEITTNLQIARKPYIADGVSTNIPGIGCAVLSADCIPVLLRDRQTGKVAAVHAGWRGLAGGILEKALAGFDLNTCEVSIGPCISQKHFEVGKDVYDAFASFSAFFIAGDSAGKWLADLPGIALAIFKKNGLAASAVAVSGRCTFTDRDLPSYRLDKTPLRMASLIWQAGLCDET